MSVATSYAKALYIAIKEENAQAEQLDQLESQMNSFEQVLNESADARKALLGPVVTAKEKAGVLTEIANKLNYSKLFLRFLVLLVEKGRLRNFKEVRKAFGNIRLNAEGGFAGDLIAAEPMTDADVKGMAEAFSRKFGKRVAFRVSTDPTLLAGMKVTVNGVTYDGTLRAQLQQIRDSLAAGATVK